MTESRFDISVNDNHDLMARVHRFCHEAMATVFEIFIANDNTEYAGQAARQAFAELDGLEQELSRFVSNSDVSRINNLEAGQLTQIGADTFNCLQLAVDMYKATDGAFDITLGTGIESLHLRDDDYTVRVAKDSIRIDLGGIGKGYAVDKMAMLLRQWDIDAALIHGGYSSVRALAGPEEGHGWPVTCSSPDDKGVLELFYLQNEVLGGSGLSKGGHIINPRNGQAVQDKLATWVCMNVGDNKFPAATTDALTTAFVVMSPAQVRRYCQNHIGVWAMLVLKGRDKNTEVLRFGSRSK
jgi:thiamine biosynthesis lipoprotein